jgi:hypothetical protein
MAASMAAINGENGNGEMTMKNVMANYWRNGQWHQWPQLCIINGQPMAMAMKTKWPIMA